MGSNPHANGGSLTRDLRLPDFRDYAVVVPQPGAIGVGDIACLRAFPAMSSGSMLLPVILARSGLTKTLSNGLEAVFGATARQWLGETFAGDEHLAPTGRVLEMLSEHQCEGDGSRVTC